MASKKKSNVVEPEIIETVVEAAAEPKRKGKAPNPDSIRQRILSTLRNSDEPLAPKDIVARMKEAFGYEEVKHINSHLDYFLKKNQVARPADGVYTIAAC